MKRVHTTALNLLSSNGNSKAEPWQRFTRFISSSEKTVLSSMFLEKSSPKNLLSLSIDNNFFFDYKTLTKTFSNVMIFNAFDSDNKLLL